jgi:hypothetical protein
MRPFSITVFRIRLLLLAVALGLTGFGGDKKSSGVAEAIRPIKAVTASCNSTQHKVRGLLVVNGVECGSKKHMGASS